MGDMVSTILSTTMGPAMKICRNTQQAVADNRPDIPSTHQPTMFSIKQTKCIAVFQKNTQTMDQALTMSQNTQKAVTRRESLKMPSNQS